MPPSYRSYAAQTAHYFDRPHDAVPAAPIASAAAWLGREQIERSDWLERIDGPVIDEIERGLDAAIARGKPLAEWTRDDVAWPRFGARIAEWRETLARGRGFLLARGFPVERWERERSEQFFWSLGLHLGEPGAQNPQGDLLGHVEDTGDDARDERVRLYRTASDIAYHCDAADVVGLLCLESARSGGASRIASSVAVWNELFESDPKLATRLFDAVALDLRNEERDGMQPFIEVVPCRHASGSLRTFYHSDYFRSVERFAHAPFGDVERALVDRYDEIAERADVRLEMELEPGDVQLVSNHTVVHARTGYEDGRGARRHLLRLWLSL